MSSPTKISASPAGTRDGTRVILREITATLHNSPPLNSSAKSGNDTLPKVLPEHEVRVNFVREFAETESQPVTHSSTESNSISSASSFQSLASTLSTKSSSGICADSPERSADASYANLHVSGLDELIAGCANIRLDTTLEVSEHSFANETFTSATEDPPFNATNPLSRTVSPKPYADETTQILDDIHLNSTAVISERLSSDLNRTQDLNVSTNNDDGPNVDLNDVELHPELQTDHSVHELLEQCALPSIASSCVNNLLEQCPLPTITDPCVDESLQECILSSQSYREIEEIVLDDAPLLNTTIDIPIEQDKSDLQVLPDIVLANSGSTLKEAVDDINLSTSSTTDIDCPLSGQIFDASPSVSSDFISVEKSTAFAGIPTALETNKVPELRIQACPIVPEQTESIAEEVSFAENNCEENNKSHEFHSFNEISYKEVNEDLLLSSPSANLNEEHDIIQDHLNSTVLASDVAEAAKASEPDQFEDSSLKENTDPVASLFDSTAILSDRQSTSISQELTSDETQEAAGKPEPLFFDTNSSFSVECQVDFEQLKEETQRLDPDIFDLNFVPHQDSNIPSSGLFRESTNFDFLLTQSGIQPNINRLRQESLYLKFDPLVTNPLNMLPQGNCATPPSSQQNGDKDISLPNHETPKKNPALAAIERLLLYSPAVADGKLEESNKIEPTEKAPPEPAPVVEVAMVKELELVRSTVLQLEEQLASIKQELQQALQQRDLQQKNHDEERNSLLEKISKLSVVVEEYEQSISRLVREQETDRKTLDVEKASLLVESQDLKNHLAASEAAFSDVHTKYERLKIVVATSKSNMEKLKESSAENIEIIKSLENRYDQLKSHAAARLEKANYELEGMRKQHDSEIVKLRAMLRKEELKSNSLTEMVEQKTKENRELTKILDEVLAKVDTSMEK